MNKKFLVLVFIILSGLGLLSACAGPVETPVPTPTAVGPVPVEPVLGLPEGTAGYPWWNDSTFYQVFVRSFQDSDGDGIGDFNGLIERLDYLNDGNPETTTDLGVTALWLLPIHPSPSYHGYDVLDYYEVNPDYGTLEDFRRLLEEARKRNIRIIIDLVVNHTSDQHPWFRAARDPNSEYRDWYVWEENNPGFVGPDGQVVWHRTSTGYYYALFWGRMPDLNYRNPQVTDQMYDIARFWLEDVGVDGFRIDGAQHLIEEGDIQRHSDDTLAWFADFQRHVKSIKPDSILVGEVWDTNFAVTRYVQGDTFDLAFNFDLARAMITGVNGGSATTIKNALGFTRRLLPEGRYGAFLTNHDMDRVMTQVGGRAERAEVAASIALTLRGVPFIYYGEEIGMVGAKPDERIRTPMQWAPETGTGFTSGSPWQRPQQDYLEKHVQGQDEDPASLLNHYRSLVHLRSRHAALRVGEQWAVDSTNQSLYATLRSSDAENILILVNLGSREINEYNLSLTDGPLAGEYQAVPLYGELAGSGEILPGPAANTRGGFDAYQPLPAVPPYSTVILQLHSR
jgi:alpha-amylase